MAGKKVGLIIAVDGEREYAEAMRSAQKETTRLNTDLNNVTKAFSQNANSMEALKKKQEVLTRTQEAYERKLNTAKNGLEAAKKVYNEQSKELESLKKSLEEAKEAQERMEKAGDKSSDEYKKQVSEVQKLEHEVSKQSAATIKASGSITDWNTKISKSEGELRECNRAIEQNEQYLKEAESSYNKCATSIDKFGNEVKDTASDLEDAGKSSSTFGDVLKANLTSEVIVSGVKKIGETAKQAAEYAVEVGSSFEAAMSEVAAISGATGSDLEALENKAKELGSSTKFSATEAAEALKYMSLAGWSTADMLSGIDGIMSLAAASGMDLASASDMVTDYLSAFGMQAEESAHLADLLAYAQANNNTSAQQLGEAYQNCAADMHAAGQDVETVTSLLEAMANQGTKGSRAGTQLSAMMRDITAKMKDGKISIGDATVAVMDAQGNYRDLTDILKDVSEATEGLGDAEKNEALSATFTADSMKGLNLVLNEGIDKVAGYEEGLRNSTGAAEHMADIMQDNLKGKLTEMNSALEGLGIAAYDYVSGPLSGVVEGVTGAISGLTEAITPQKDALGEFIESVKNTNEETQKALDNASQTVDNAQAEANYIRNLGDELIKVNGVEKKSAEEKWKVKEIVDKLSGDIPELAEAYDNETGSVNLTAQEIENLVSAKEKLIKTNAMQSANNDLVQAYADAKQNAKDAEIAIGGITEKLEEYKKKLKELEDAGEAGNPQSDYTSYAALVQQYTRELQKEQDELSKSQELMKESKTKAQDYTAALEELYDMSGDGAEGQGQLNSSLKKTAYEANYGLTQLSALNKGLEKNAEAADESEKTNSDLTNTIENQGIIVHKTAETTEEALETMKKAAQDGAAAQKEAMHSILDTYHSYVSEIEADLQNKVNVADKFDSGKAINTQTMLDNLQSGVEGLTKYKESLQRIVDEVGGEIAPEFMEYLMEIGNESPEIINNLVAAMDAGYGVDRIKEMSKEYMEALDLSDEIATIQASNKTAIDALQGDLGSSAPDFSELRESINGAITGPIREELNNAVDMAQQIGVKIPDGLAEGIASEETSAESALAQLNGAIQGTMDGMLKMAEEAGASITPEIANGIEAGGQEAVDAYVELVTLLAQKSPELQKALEDGVKTDEVKSSVESSIEPGAKAIDEQAPIYQEKAKALGESIAAGIEESKQAIEDAVSNVVQVGSEKIGEKEEDYKAAGTALGKEAATGMDESKSEVEKTAEIVSATGAKSAEGKKGDYKTAGKALVESMANGLVDGQAAIENAAMSVVQAGANTAGSDTTGFENAGLNLARGLAGGVIQGSSIVQEASRKVISDAENAAKDEAQIHSPSTVWRDEIGANMTKGAAVGVTEEGKTLQSAAVKVVENSTKSAKEAAKKNIKSVKEELKKELREDLSDNTLGKISSNFDVSRTKNTGSGKSEKTQTKTDEEYYSEVYQAAQKYYSNMNSLYDATLGEQKQFWERVKATLAEGTQGWMDASKQLKSVKEKIKTEEAKVYDTIVDNAEKYISHRKTLGNISAAQELEYWKTTRASLKKGTDAWYEATDKIKSARDNIISENEAYVERQKSLGRMDAESEAKHWEKIKNYLKKGTDAWYDAKDKIANAHAEMIKEGKTYIEQQEALGRMSEAQVDAYWEKMLKKVKGDKTATAQINSIIADNQQTRDEYAISGGALDTYKTYFKVSARAEVDYWDTVRKKYKAGTLERAEADKKYLDALNSYNDQRKSLEDDYYDKVTDVTEKLEENIQDVTQSTEESIKKVTEKMEDEIKSLNDSYADAVRQRENAIYSATNLTDKFESESDDGATLLYNLKTQVVGLDDWRNQLDKLKAKGIDQELIDELQDMGPQASAMLHIMNNDLPDELQGKGMTDDQLKEYVDLWRQKKELAKTEAEEENEQLRKENEQKIAVIQAQAAAERAQLQLESEQKIADLKAQAQAEITAYTEEYLSAMEELSKPMNESLLHVAKRAGEIGEETISNYIQGIYNKVVSKNSKSSLLATTDTITTNLAKLEKDGKTIGSNTLDGILKAMNDSKKIKSSTSKMVQAIVSATKKAAKINSPSKLFEDEVGEYIPAGVGEGVEKNTEAAVKPAENMVQKMLEAAENRQSTGNIKLSDYIKGAELDAGASRLNAAIQAQFPRVDVNVDTGELVMLLSQAITEIRNVTGAVGAVGNQQIVLDTGKLVGEIARPISQELALDSRAKNRGRF